MCVLSQFVLLFVLLLRQSLLLSVCAVCVDVVCVVVCDVVCAVVCVVVCFVVCVLVASIVVVMCLCCCL